MTFREIDFNNQELGEILKISQATKFISEKEDGINSYIEQRGKNFSGGQKQRLNIARTLLKKTEVLIKYDSTSALDLETEAKLLKQIKDKMEKTTVIMIAQRISKVMEVDKIIILDNGRISNIGMHRELLKESDI